MTLLFSASARGGNGSALCWLFSPPPGGSTGHPQSGMCVQHKGTAGAVAPYISGQLAGIGVDKCSHRIKSMLLNRSIRCQAIISRPDVLNRVGIVHPITP